MAHVMNIKRLTLRDMIKESDLYSGLPDGLTQLPVPSAIRINRKRYSVPETMDELAKKICYGQRLFLTRKEDNDFGWILRAMDGYFYPKIWDEDKALLFGKYILPLRVVDLYPVAMHLITLVSEMVEREQALLHREPTKVELAAGIESLNVYSELTNLDFLSDVMKCTIPEVLLQPYTECLVRFMKAKADSDYQEKYYKEMQLAQKQKAKK